MVAPRKTSMEFSRGAAGDNVDDVAEGDDIRCARYQCDKLSPLAPRLTDVEQRQQDIRAQHLLHSPANVALQRALATHDRIGSWPCENAAVGVLDGGSLSPRARAVYALMAAINGLMPTMFITRVRL
jgi:hypothetical protein